MTTQVVLTLKGAITMITLQILPQMFSSEIFNFEYSDYLFWLQNNVLYGQMDSTIRFDVAPAKLSHYILMAHRPCSTWEP